MTHDCRNVRFLGVLIASLLLWPGSLGAALEDEVRAYEAYDLLNPPPKGPILFIGSSTIRMWSNLQAAFPRHTVLNRGFGGSQMSDVLDYFDRLVSPYSPALIVLYEGDNDLSGGKSAAQVFADYTNFLVRVEAELPNADVALVSVKPSPSRVQTMPAMVELNEMLRSLADGLHVRFVDAFTPMLNASGQPRPELFLSDMLHMNAAGYALWQSIFTPVLDSWTLSRGQDFLFDFGSADLPTTLGTPPNDPSRSWNNLTNSFSGQGLTNLVTTRKLETPLKLIVVESFGGANQNGAATAPGLPANASLDSLFGNTEAFGGHSNVFPQFKLTGLETNLVCFFEFFAARAGVADNRETVYSVWGGHNEQATLNAANNTSNWARVYSLPPDPAGEITVSLAPGTHNNNANHFTYLGVMRLTVAPPQTPIEITLQPIARQASASGSVTFSVRASGARPYYVRWMSNGIPIPGADDLSYTIPSVHVGMSGSLYSAAVSNVLYGAVSAAAELTVLADTNPPVLLSARALSDSLIELRFDKPVAPGASNPAYYLVNGSSISSATLLGDAATVRLMLASPISGVFTVTVKQVDDLWGNLINPETQASGVVPEPRAQAVMIDFGGGSTTERGPAPDDPVNHWNNLTDPAGSLLNMITVGNEPSGISLISIRRFNGANLNGTTSSTNFPADATTDSFYGNTEVFNGLANVFPSFKLSGLQIGQAYDLEFYASRTGVSDNRETLYTVQAALTNTTTLNAANNISNTARFNAMLPDSQGEMIISLTPGLRNNNANHFTYLGVMRISPAARMRFLPPVIKDQRIQLFWIIPAFPESAPTLAGPWTNLTLQPVLSFSEEILPGQNRFYRLRREQ